MTRDNVFIVSLSFPCVLPLVSQLYKLFLAKQYAGLFEAGDVEAGELKPSCVIPRHSELHSSTRSTQLQ